MNVKFPSGAGILDIVLGIIALETVQSPSSWTGKGFLHILCQESENFLSLGFDFYVSCTSCICDQIPSRKQFGV